MLESKKPLEIPGYAEFTVHHKRHPKHWAIPMRAAALLFALCGPASGQLHPNQTRFSAVESFKGTYSIDVQEIGSGVGPLGPYSYRITRGVRATLNLNKRVINGWEGSATGSVVIDEEVRWTTPGCAWRATAKGSETLDGSRLKAFLHF